MSKCNFPTTCYYPGPCRKLGQCGIAAGVIQPLPEWPRPDCDVSVAGSYTLKAFKAVPSDSLRERIARGTEPAAALHARIVRASNPSHPGHNWVRDNWVAEARCPWDNWKPSKDIAC